MFSSRSDEVELETTLFVVIKRLHSIQCHPGRSTADTFIILYVSTVQIKIKSIEEKIAIR
eukprot:scaffold105158_cov31-Prasinocladus_malaysianus.AAC.2